MSGYPTRKIRESLLAKGLELQKTHHEMYWLVVGGVKRPIHTYVSHGAREYDDAFLGKMAQQMRLRRKELDEFIECPLGFGQYVRLLIERDTLKTTPSGHTPQQ